MRSTLIVALTAAVSWAVRIAAARETRNFNADWRFARGDPEEAAAPAFDDSAWTPVRLPHDWAIAGPFNADEPGHTGKLPWRGEGWYRKTFRLDADPGGRRAILLFDGVMSHPTVYLNGHEAGSWRYGYNSFWLDITGPAAFGLDNVVAVHADTRSHESRWYPGAGIYRKVTLILADAVHVPVWGVAVTTPDVTDARAHVRVRTTVTNATAQAHDVVLSSQVRDPAGRRAGGAETRRTLSPAEAFEFDQEVVVDRPQRWDVETPRLYSVHSAVSRDGRECDTLDTPFGIRTFEWTVNDGFHLNGRRLQLQGVNNHHDQGPLGAALLPRAIERQLEIMKDMGVNAIRTSHNPPAPDLLDLCDRMGLVVFDEAFDKWGGTAGFRGPTAEFVAGPIVPEIRNFILRDRNHPSVVVWSIGNEIGDILGNRDGRSPELVRRVVEMFRGWDPTRPTTLGCHMTVAVNPNSHVLDAVDIMSWNYDRKYAQARKRYPDKPAVYSESASAFSTVGYYELPLPRSKTDYSPAKQLSSHDRTAAQWSDLPDLEFRRMAEDRYCAGEFVWTGFDYLGEPTPFAREARSSYFGIVDLCGVPKDRFFLYRSLWNTREATVHLLPHWNWKGHEGRPVPVYVYTSGDEAELFLNGRSLGRRRKKSLAELATPRATALPAGRPSLASSEETDKGNRASLAADGDPETRWCAADGTFPQWWQTDLGAPTPLRFCTIDWEQDADGYRFRLDVSDDGTAWRTAADQRAAGVQSIQASLGLDATGRHVRIVVTGAKENQWASIREVRLNAESGGAENPYYAVTDVYRLRWNEAPYEPGELKAVAYRDGRKIGEAVRRTAGEPAALRLSPDRTDLRADGDDLSYVRVEAVDRDGIPCPLADVPVRFKVTGPADLAAVGNGDPLSLDPFVADRGRLFYGKAMAIVRTRAGNGGVIHVAAESDGLRAAEVRLGATNGF